MCTRLPVHAMFGRTHTCMCVCCACALRVFVCTHLLLLGCGESGHTWALDPGSQVTPVHGDPTPGFAASPQPHWWPRPLQAVTATCPPVPPALFRFSQTGCCQLGKSSPCQPLRSTDPPSIRDSKGPLGPIPPTRNSAVLGDLNSKRMKLSLNLQRRGLPPPPPQAQTSHTDSWRKGTVGFPAKVSQAGPNSPATCCVTSGKCLSLPGPLRLCVNSKEGAGF